MLGIKVGYFYFAVLVSLWVVQDDTENRFVITYHLADLVV